MHPVAALTRLFGDLAKYTCVRGAPLPDGSPLERGGTPAQQDPRDADKVVLAGRLSGALYRVQQAEHGSTMVAVLEAYFTRAGITGQTQRLLETIEALEKRGVRVNGMRPRKPGKRPPEKHLRRYEALLSEAITSYGAALNAP
jgi:hypothetical protein